MCTLIEIVKKAINSFNEDERYLIENTLSERCICSRFALHITNELIEQKYSGYVVDVEYNRNYRDIKHIDNNSGPITVDLVVHKRGNNPAYNLICIEMKKSSNKRGCADDELRLCKMTDSHCGFNYKLGVMIVINMPRKNKKEQGLLRIESIVEKGIIEKATPNM